MPSQRFVERLDRDSGATEVDLCLEIVGPDGPIMTAGGRWDRVGERYLDDPPETAHRIKLHSGQVEPAKWFARWLAARASGSKDPPTYTMIMWGGRGGGKTFETLAFLILYALAMPRAIVWIVNQTSLSGKECEDALDELLLPATWCTKEVVEREIRYYLANKSMFRLRGAARPGRLKAGRVDIALLNEGAEMSVLAYDNVRGRIIDKSGLVIVASNPANKESGRWIEELKNRADHNEVAAVEFTVASEDNPHIDQAAQKARQAELSEVDWLKERYGIVGPIGTVALHAWRRTANFIDVPDHYIDVTPEITDRIFGESAPYVIGMDFQIHPYCCGVVHTYYRDPETGRVFDWASDYFMGADEHEAIREGEDLGYDGADVIVVPDWSGTYQDAKHATRATPSARILAEAGWRRIRRPDPTRNKNPDVIARCRAANALLRNAEGLSTAFVARDLPDLAESLERLPLKHGKPDGRSRYSHLYDAWSYPAYLFYLTMVVQGG